MPLKYTFKKTGTVLRVFESAADRLAKKRIENLRLSAADVAERFDTGLRGFVVLAWDKDGSYFARWVVGPGNVCMNNLPDWAAGALRREIAEVDYRRDIFGEETDPA